MKPNNFLILVGLGFLLACGPIALPGVSETKPQQASSPPTVQLASQPTEKITNSGSSPVATPNSPIATPTPEHSRYQEAGRETDKVSVSDEVAIIFHRKGGFAGIDERWVIYFDGRIEGPGDKQWQVKSEQIQQLLGEIEGLGFFQMKDAYIPQNTCCDRLTYQITVQRDQKTHTVTTIDAAPDAPQKLWEIIDAIGRLIVEAAG